MKHMNINKDLKSAVVHPSQAYLQKTSLFFNCRIEAYKNLMHELFPEKFIGTANYNSINDHTPQAKHREANIKEMCSLIITNKLLDKQSTNRGLLNVFTGQRQLLNKPVTCYHVIKLV